MKKISVVIPLHNGESTIIETLKSLYIQNRYFDELIIVDDFSTDNSLELIKGLFSNCEFKLITHDKSYGLAKSYNDSVRDAKGDLIITLHQDVVLMEDSLKKLIEVFEKDENVVASTHVVIHPKEIWNNYNFWQKCFFARLVGKKFYGMDGKFDCYKKSALESAGLFDEKHFKTAGEDGDIFLKLKKIGKIIQTDAEIVHLHKMDKKFKWTDLIYKQAQYSEAKGAVFRIHKNINTKSFFLTFFRELLLISLAFPIIRIFSIVLIIIYAFVYTKEIYLNEWRDKRILVLPFLNIGLLVVSLIYSIKGFVYGKQQI